jgi:manganese oxidase
MNDFNIFTVNGKVFPATAPLVVRTGQRVRIRLGNLGATDHHPFHIHGHAFRITGTDAGRVPESAWVPAATVLVSVGSTRDIEFIADASGDWPFHCHMTHHTMNQMGHGLPNMLGVKPGPLDGKVRKLLPDYMTMGERGMGNMGGMSEAMGVPPNSIPMLGGTGPFGPIDMGGMFTIVKVRDGITTYEDPGWYRHPPGTVAERASAAAMRADGITA